MKRNIPKLIEDYRKKFFNAPANSQRGQLYAYDYHAILELAGVKKTTEAWNVVSLAMMAGVMIGYAARKAEERENRKRGKKNEA